MKLLITAATSKELYPPSAARQPNQMAGTTERIQRFGHEILQLTTGPGMVSTAYHLTRTLAQERFDLAIQIGVAGSFDRSIALADVVYVETDVLADLGADSPGGFLSIFELGLIHSEDAPFQQGQIRNPPYPNAELAALRSVHGLTRNTVTGDDRGIRRWEALHNTIQIETMEGAAFYYVCQMEKLPCIQIRGISNYIEIRNRENWKLDEALASVRGWLNQFLQNIADPKAKSM